MWSNEWGRKIIFAHGSNISKGVCVLINRKLNCKIEKCTVDQDGRYIILHVNINDRVLTFVNIYAPNTD